MTVEGVLPKLWDSITGKHQKLKSFYSLSVHLLNEPMIELEVHLESRLQDWRSKFSADSRTLPLQLFLQAVDFLWPPCRKSPLLVALNVTGHLGNGFRQMLITYSGKGWEWMERKREGKGGKGGSKKLKKKVWELSSESRVAKSCVQDEQLVLRGELLTSGPSNLIRSKPHVETAASDSMLLWPQLLSPGSPGGDGGEDGTEAVLGAGRAVGKSCTADFFGVEAASTSTAQLSALSGDSSSCPGWCRCWLRSGPGQATSLRHRASWRR
eukprot:s1143_g14.t1